VPVVPDDDLLVGGRRIRGESPRGREIRDCLARGRPLASVGVRWALAETDQPGAVPESALVGMRRVYSRGSLALYENPAAPRPADPDLWRRLALAMAYLLALATVAGSAVASAVHVRLRKTRTDW
jgi:hypothetical protein